MSMTTARLSQLLVFLALPTSLQPSFETAFQPSNDNMAGKIIALITGGNSGLGYYAVQQLATTGKYHVLMGSRSLGKAETAIKSLVNDTSMKVDAKDVDAIQIDVSSDASIAAAAEAVEKNFGYLDILMVNAGIAEAHSSKNDGSEPSLRETYQALYDTNVFGAAVTVDKFVPLLRRSQSTQHGKRISFTSSGLASLTMAAEASSGGKDPRSYPIYRSTKTALSMVMLYYARLLGEEGFTVTAADPGFCATNLNNHQGKKDPRDGAKVLIYAATEASEKVHGRIVNLDGPEPW